MSLAASAIRAGGTQTSSTISAVPGIRRRPTRPWSPSRTRQLTPIFSRSRVNSAGRIRLSSSTASIAARSLSSSDRLVVGAELDQEHRRLGRQLEPVLRRAGDVHRRDHQRGRDHQLDRARAQLDQVGHGRAGLGDAGEVEPRGRGVGGHRQRLEGRVADQRERSLRADDEAAEDLDGLVGVEERAEAVAGGVLDLVLARGCARRASCRRGSRREARRGRRPARAPRPRSARRRRARTCRSACRSRSGRSCR